MRLLPRVFRTALYAIPSSLHPHAFTTRTCVRGCGRARGRQPRARFQSVRRTHPVREIGRALVSGVKSWDEITPWLVAWGAFASISIATNVLVSLNAYRLAHHRRLASMADYFEHVMRLPSLYHAETHTGRLKWTPKIGPVVKV